MTRSPPARLPERTHPRIAGTLGEKAHPRGMANAHALGMQFARRLHPHLALAVGVLAGFALAANGCSSNNPAPSGQNDAGRDASPLDSSAIDANEASTETPDAGSDSALDGTVDASDAGDGGLPGTPGPGDSGATLPSQTSGADGGAGQQVFRYETFGNEGFWTRVMELPQGLIANNTTPAQALALGLSIDVDKLPNGLASTIQSELADAGAANADPNSSEALRNPANLAALLEANAIIGLSARNVTTLNGQLDIDANDVFAGESVGVSCALCHSISDGSVLQMTGGGSIGHRVDGPTNHNIQLGQMFALANHSIALYPMLGLHLTSNNDMSVTRRGNEVLMNAPPTEMAVDQYLNDSVLSPVGMFDDQADGNGAPLHIQSLFRQDLAAPYGSEGSIHKLENFSNYYYTVALDPTDLLASTPAANDPADAGAAAASFSGGQYLEFEKAGATGLEILTNYKNVIENILGIPPFANTGDGGASNNGYPFVAREGECVSAPAGVENEASIAGLKCAQAKLLDLNTYLFSLRPPPGTKTDPATIATGRVLFRQQCTQCHNDDQSLPVPQDVVPFNSRVDLFANAPARPALYPDWLGTLIVTRPGAPFAPLVPAKDYTQSIYDDKMIYTEASNYGQPRGVALPLLMDLARKPSFLHDDEVSAGTGASDSLSLLLNPSRGPTAPHPFYITSDSDRVTVVAFLKSLDDSPIAP